MKTFNLSITALNTGNTQRIVCTHMLPLRIPNLLIKHANILILLPQNYFHDPSTEVTVDIFDPLPIFTLATTSLLNKISFPLLPLIIQPHHPNKETST